MNYLEKKLAFVDIETTGPNSRRDRVIDVSVKIVYKNKVIESFESLIDPGRSIPPFIQRFTGITPQMVEGEPAFETIAEQLHAILQDCVFIAHNVRFDFNFLKAEFAKAGLDFHADKLCTVKLSRTLFPEYKKHNLDEVIRRCELKIDTRHRAESDCEALVQFWDYLHRNFESKFIANAFAVQVAGVQVPARLNRRVIDALPEGPGVYILHAGKGKEVLYIGRSVNIKDGVLSHFSISPKSKKAVKIQSLVDDISYYETEGDFSSLMLESKLMKIEKPSLNKKVREHRSLYHAQYVNSEEGLVKLEISEFTDLDPSQKYVGLYRSKKDFERLLLRLAKNHDLCHQALGIEKYQDDSCFNYKIDKCKGVCIKEESVKQHNRRLKSAFAKYEIRPWPFKGMLLLKEGNISHLIDNWCYLRKIESHSELNEAMETVHDYKFDYDEYLVLKKFLNGNYDYDILSKAKSLDL